MRGKEYGRRTTKHVIIQLIRIYLFLLSTCSVFLFIYLFFNGRKDCSSLFYIILRHFTWRQARGCVLVQVKDLYLHNLMFNCAHLKCERQRHIYSS